VVLIQALQFTSCVSCTSISHQPNGDNILFSLGVITQISWVYVCKLKIVIRLLVAFIKATPKAQAHGVRNLSLRPYTMVV
jgi:hypothetical protein